MYLYIKAIHIIFVVSWFAGLFYIVRLFIYHTEANERPETERTILQKQFEIMESRLWYIITVPAMVLTILSGVWLMMANNWHTQPWLHIKLLFVLLLLWYHFKCQSIMNNLKKGIFKWSATKLRVWNEIATILLFAIVFLVVLKSSLDWLWGLLGLVFFSIVIMTAVKIYKHYRKQQ